MGTAKMLSRALPPGFVADSSPPQKLPSRNGADNDKRLLPRRHRVGQRGIWRLMGQILLAGEEAQERPALLRNLVADRPAQHRKAGLERVEDRPQCQLAVELKLYFTAVGPRRARGPLSDAAR